MKAGILSFQNANNYGAVLQAYALQKYLKTNSVDSEFVNYNMSASMNSNKVNICINKIKENLLFLKNKNDYNKIVKFKKFRKKNLKINKKEIYNPNNLYNLKKSNYDILVVGSDQVWNLNITKNSNFFYLPEKYNIPKVSYAASFGTDKLGKAETDAVKDYLCDFSSISVRENQVVNKIKEITNKDVHCVVDPVFLLTSNEWKQVMSPYKLPSKYICIYLMENIEGLDSIIEQINKYSQEQYDIVIIGKNGQLLYNNNYLRIEDAGPSEFIYIINNAEYVVTNSFHGTAFSIILDKKLYVISHSKYNARIDNILKLINAQDKIIKNPKCIEDNLIKDKDCSKLIEQIKISKTFIADNIINRGDANEARF